MKIITLLQILIKLKSEMIKSDENIIFPKLELVFEKESRNPLIADYFMPVGYLLGTPPPEVEVNNIRSKIEACEISDVKAKQTIDK